MHAAEAPPARWGHRLAALTAATTLLLLVAGGLVTSQGVGMAVPDWPTTYGHNMFTYPISRWTGGVLFEHSHRLLGSLVGLLTLVMAFTLWKTHRSRRTVQALGTLACVVVLVQGFLGGFRVLFDARLLAVVHGSLAHAFFALLVAIAVVTGPPDATAGGPADAAARARLRREPVALAAVVYAQIVLGAIVRHLGIDHGALVLHLSVAAVIPLLTLRCSELLRTSMAGLAVDHARRLVLLVHVQLFLGVAAFLAKRYAPDPATAPWPTVLATVAHQVVGAAVLATTVACALRAHDALAGPAAEAEAVAGSLEVAS